MKNHKHEWQYAGPWLMNRENRLKFVCHCGAVKFVEEVKLNEGVNKRQKKKRGS